MSLTIQYKKFEVKFNTNEDIDKGLDHGTLRQSETFLQINLEN